VSIKKPKVAPIVTVGIKKVRSYLDPNISAPVKSFSVIFDDGADGFISGNATKDGFIITAVDEKGNRGTDIISDVSPKWTKRARV
jgi:hypothetical protein